MHDDPNPSGLCLCGCGEATPIAPRTDRNRGRVKGKHMRYVRGHNARLSPAAWTVDEATGCWEWQRFKLADGYGKVRRGAKVIPAHRAMWQDIHGPLATTLEVHHLCGNRGCVNPDHLEALSARDHAQLHALLTPEQVAEIQDAPRVRGTGLELARRFGVSPSVISNVRTGKTWR